VLRRILLGALIVVAGLAAMLGGLFYYFLYTPDPVEPQLAGQFQRGATDVNGLSRTYLLYVPKNLPPGAPLVVALHSSDGGSQQMRRATGFGFERLADEYGFAVVYPNGYDGNWNACNIVGDYAANKLNIDDVAFLSHLVDVLATRIGIDRDRVFAVGLSRGGHMAFRLALEAPSRFRAVAVVAAGLPASDNFKCAPAPGMSSSILIMNGTADPLNPFNGGEVQIMGMFARGTVRSSEDSARYFARLNDAREADLPGGRSDDEEPTAQRTLWRNAAGVEVEHVALVGAGHVMPQPWASSPRLLGRSPTLPNGPELIWHFFERQAATSGGAAWKTSPERP